ncbi:hypothetical protein RchiOBHm_Chr6g0290611 [Rosa chinensis]|uniref:Uncharacterized protein n=1 Tax=Rosa chinensis TaxID=74649 RepID=A0A2P6PVW5_ROSCH|nr:hypothetical protein RchiOBHm_Chr6g0290611 [Rosa chinensis]
MDYATKTSLDPFFYFITQFLKAGPLKEYKRSAVQLLLICATSQIVRTLVAVAIQSLQGIIFLRWDLSAQTLNFAKIIMNMATGS